ncbi:MAG: hypothetical protein ACFFA6_09000 [Promethearchaeota archaeon]
MPDEIDIEDLESFIDGLKSSLDTLEGLNPKETQGFQAQLAKAISNLRIKKSSKFEPLPKYIGHVTKDDLKNYLIKELEELRNLLDTDEYSPYPRRKFNLIMKIAKLREKISRM